MPRKCLRQVCYHYSAIASLTKSQIFVYDTHSIECCNTPYNRNQLLSIEPVSGPTLPNTDVTLVQICCLL